MSTNSAIEWTDTTWNPVVGCTWASPGCDHCYAARMTRRLEAMGKKDYAGLTTKKHFNGKVRTLEHRLAEPLRWKKPCQVFVNSMSDLFHSAVPDEFIDRVFAVMALCSQHTFQILTKRPERMAEYLRTREWSGGCVFLNVAPWGEMTDAQCETIQRALPRWPLPNVWLGTSVENQEFADKRRAAMRQLADLGCHTWVSYEPALGPVNWQGWEFLHWLVSGGESGPGARPSHPDWHRAARDFCDVHDVPFFFKQWGAFLPLADWRRLPPDPEGPTFELMPKSRIGLVSPFPDTNDDRAGTHIEMCRTGKKAAGRLLDGVEHNGMPAVGTDNIVSAEAVPA